jgi:hypothetical protein
MEMQTGGLSVCAAALALTVALVGCGASADFFRAGAAGTSSSTTLPRGGTFTADYSGNYSLEKCVPGSRRQDGFFTFSGTGIAKFIHASTEEGQMQRSVIGDFCVPKWYGTATLTSKAHPKNTLQIALTTRENNDNPCTEAVLFTVTGGTGKFVNASGSGQVTFTCAGYGSASYTDQWGGSISY